VAQDTAHRLLARVKQRRESLGLTQEAFAERAGLGYKYYQAVEAGRKRDLRLSTLEKLAKACGLELWELLELNAPLPELAEPPANATPKSAGRAAVGKAPKARR